MRLGDTTQSGVSIMDAPRASDRWPADLSGVFRALIVDEAHQLRNPKSFSHQAISWVKADFNILMTATPVWGHPRDFEGLLALCEPPGLSSDAAAALCGAPRHTDPWLLLRGDKRRKLRFTVWAFSRFVVEESTVSEHFASLGLNSEGEVDEGADETGGQAYFGGETFSGLDISHHRADRLRDVFRRYVSRHDYETRLEGRGRIGSQVPPRLLKGSILCSRRLKARHTTLGAPIG
jgi:hypothetical protein